MTNELATIFESFKSWMLQEAGWTQGTVDKYSSNLRRIIAALCIKSISDFNAENINMRWKTQLWEEIDTNQRLSDATRMSYLVSLKSFLKWAENANVGIETGLSQAINLPRVPKIQYSGLNQAEQKRLREHLTLHLENDAQRRNAALILFLWSTGCRISEALQLEVNASGIILTDDFTRSGSFEVGHDDKGRVTFYAYVNGKGKKNRTLSVSFEAISYINLYLDMRPQKSTHLFLNHRHSVQPGRRGPGEPLQRLGAYAAVKAVFARAGVEPKKQVVTHILRHTAITTWIRLGYPDKWILNQTGLTQGGLEIYHMRQREYSIELVKKGNPINQVTMKPELRRLEMFIGKKYGRLPPGLSV